MFITFMDRIFRRSKGTEGFQFGGVRILSLLFAEDVILLAPLGGDLQFSLEWFATEFEAVGVRISTPKSETMVLHRSGADSATVCC